MTPRGQLAVAMLVIASLGMVARRVASPELAGTAGTDLLLLLPLLPVAALCVSQAHPGVRWGAGVGAGLAAAFCHFVLLDPQDNQDANIGLGLYLLGGFVVVLGPAALVGGLIGRWLLPHLPADAPAAPLSWQGWGWPLLLPLVGSGFHFWAELRLLQRVREEYPQVSLSEPNWLLAGLSVLPTLLLWLGAAALPLVLLRDQARQQRRTQPWLTGWWAAAALLSLGQFVLMTWPRLRG